MKELDRNRSDGFLASAFRIIIHILVIAILIGTLIVVVYGIQARTVAEVFSIVATGLLVGDASLGTGGCISSGHLRHKGLFAKV